MPFQDYYRNNDGSIVFDDGTGAQIRGSGPAAEAKARQIDAMRTLAPMAQPSPELAALAAGGEDQRTASAEDVIRTALSPKADVPPPMLRRPDAPPEVPPTLARPPEKQQPLQIKRTLTPEEAATLEASERKKEATVSTEDKLAQMFGNKEAPLPPGLKPAERPGERPPGDVDPSKVRFAGGAAPQLLPPMTGGGKVVTKEMLAGRQTQQTIIPDEDKAAILAAGQEKYNAAPGIIDAQTERAKLVAQAWREENANLMREQEASRQRMTSARAEYAQMIDGVRRMNDDVQNQGIHSYWEGKSTGEKFVSAIAVGLGVIGAGLQRKQTNAPLQMLTKAMDDDLDRQKTMLQNKRQGVAEANSLLGRYHDLLGDMQAAESAARASMLEAAGRRVDQIMKETESPLIQANGKAMLAGIQQENALERAKLDAYVEHKAFKTVQIGGGVPNRPFAKNDGSFLDLPGGVSLKASSPEMAMQWRQQLDNIPEIKESCAELRAELAKGPSVTNTAKVKLLVNNIATSLGAAKIGTPRMTGQGELENVSHILDTGDKVTSDVLGRTRAALDVAEHTADSAHRRIMNSAPRYTAGVPTASGELIRYQLGQPQPQNELRMQAVE
jgi:hypothetical protein